MNMQTADTITAGRRIPLRRHALSLVEVMCALFVIVVALLTAIGQMQIVNESSDTAGDHARIQEIGSSLLDRIVGADPDSLGTATLAWSLPRYEDNVANDAPPLTETTAVAADNIQTQRLALARSGLLNLRIFVEYYRGLQEPNGVSTPFPGVMDGTYTSATNFSTQFRDATFRANRRLTPGTAIMTQVLPNNPVVIRLIILWDPGQRLELYSVKLRPST